MWWPCAPLPPSLLPGISPSSNKERLREAHKRIMLLNHPDRGGSLYLAAKINEAKDYLESGGKTTWEGPWTRHTDTASHDLTCTLTLHHMSYNSTHSKLLFIIRSMSLCSMIMKPPMNITPCIRLVLQQSETSLLPAAGNMIGYFAEVSKTTFWFICKSSQ